MVWMMSEQQGHKESQAHVIAGTGKKEIFAAWRKSYGIDLRCMPLDLRARLAGVVAPCIPAKADQHLDCKRSLNTHIISFLSSPTEPNM